MNFIEELKWRGLVKDVTDYDGLVNALNDHMTFDLASCYCFP